MEQVRDRENAPPPHEKNSSKLEPFIRLNHLCSRVLLVTQSSKPARERAVGCDDVEMMEGAPTIVGIAISPTAEGPWSMAKTKHFSCKG